MNTVRGLKRSFADKIEREKSMRDTSMVQNLQDRASMLAAIEAQRSRKLLKELFIHLLFFTIFILILLLQRDVQSCSEINSGVSLALFTQQIDNNLQPFPKTYTDVGQWEEYRDYLMGCFVPGIMSTQDYSGRNLTKAELYDIEYVNKVVGAVRFRQLRVRNDSCNINDVFDEVVSVCYNPQYNARTRDTAPFGPGKNHTKYKFTENSGGVEFYAHQNLGFWDKSGYVVDIPVDEDFGDNVQKLIDDNWFGPATRAIIIEVNILSVNYNNRMTSLSLLTEFTAAGQASPYYSFRTFRLFMYATPLDSFRAFLEILFCIFLAYYIIALFRQWVVDYNVGRTKEYFMDLWNLIEIVNLVLFLIATIMYLAYLGSDRAAIDPTREDYIVEVEGLAADAIQFYQIAAINILLSAFKTFKYLKLNPRLYALWETMYAARIDMATYMIMFLIIILGFLFFGWLTFGADLAEFNGFSSSLGTLWQFLIGNPPDYDALASSNRVLGPVYYALFTIFVFFILVNMFVAIVSNSYDNVCEKVANKGELKASDIKKPLKRIVKMAKVFFHRKPLYSETDLLRMLKNRNLLEKSVLTKQELESELRAMGEDPLSLYIERLLAIHSKRKKYLAELLEEEKERQEEAAEAAHEAEVEGGINGAEGSVSVEMDASPEDVKVTTQLDELMQKGLSQRLQQDDDDADDANNNNSYAASINYATTSAINNRLDTLEQKMDTLMQKVDLLLQQKQK